MIPVSGRRHLPTQQIPAATHCLEIQNREGKMPPNMGELLPNRTVFSSETNSYIPPVHDQ
jgi:hypothetical protein